MPNDIDGPTESDGKCALGMCATTHCRVSAFDIGAAGGGGDDGTAAVHHVLRLLVLLTKLQHINRWHRQVEVVDDWILYLLFCVYLITQIVSADAASLTQSGCCYTNFRNFNA